MSTSEAQAREQLPLKDFTERAYLDYAMYVILDRALPHLADGLKPVHRRIVYAMSELGLSAQSKPKKSARTVGDVLGKYHPHGDMACYEAMVLMAQPFSSRYPLIDGQGNWGSPDDPKSFAAMRYTESRLTPYAQTLLSELEMGTVDWAPNFDGSLDEPRLLPARLPNVLLNGATGIAVGMATDIPPHNLREVVAACVVLLKDPDADWAAISACIPAPDFPTGGEITSSPAELAVIYQTGYGSVRLRGRWEMDDDQIVITTLPYMVSGSRLLEQIAGLMHEKKVPWLEDLRDESDHEHPTRLVLVPRGKRGDDLDSCMAHLCAITDLERSYRVNLNMIGLDGRPQVKDLRTILQEWLRFRVSTVRRRLEFRLRKVLDRLHILAGLLIAFLNIDEVIAIIRENDEPKPILMTRFELSDFQADAILDLRLRHLARLEEFKIRGEQDELATERKSLEETLASPARLNALIVSELEQDAEKYGDARRSPLVERAAAKPVAAVIAVSSEPVTIILSRAGWIRCAKGHELDPTSLSFRTGDEYLTSIRAYSSRPAYVLDSGGRAYQLNVNELPSARGQGEPLTGRLNLPAGSSFVALLGGADEDQYVLGSDEGYGFVVNLADLQSRNRAGKAVVALSDGANLMSPQRIGVLASDRLVLASSTGKLLVFPVAELPTLAKGKGLKLMALRAKEGERVVALATVPLAGRLRVTSGKRTMTLTAGDLDAHVAARASRGRDLPRGWQRVERIEAWDS